MVDWVIRPAAPPEPTRRGRRLARDPRQVRTSGVEVAVQEQPLGTGDAVASARAALEGFDGDVLVLSGDTPLLTAELLRSSSRRTAREGAAATMLAFEPPDPRLYGRIVRGADGSLLRDRRGHATRHRGARAIREINSSIYVFRSETSGRRSSGSSRRTSQGELYLTDTIEILVADGGPVAAARRRRLPRDRRGQHARRARRGRGRAARPDQRARTCSPA